MELIGRVLWWSDRDEIGIIVDLNGNEFFFDRSVLNLKPNQTIAPDSIVKFNSNKSITDCLCARDVEVPVAKAQKSLKRQYQLQSRTSA